MNIETKGNFYTTEPAYLMQGEHSLIERLKNKILATSEYKNNLILNMTWLNCNDTDIWNWFKQYDHNDTQIFLTAYIDGIEWFLKTELYKFISESGFKITIDGFGPNNWHSFLLDSLYKYNEAELELSHSPDYTYLSYNRKPRHHRENLVRQLIDNELLSNGWVTYEKGIFPEIDKLSGNTETVMPTGDTRFSRPEDLRTLGDITKWKQSYCIVVSETEPSDPWHISEKTWKPIMGLRPYLLNANAGVSKVLSNLGFYTPGQLFDCPELDNGSTDTIVNFLKELVKEDDLYLKWCNQKEMLYHNRNRFIELCSNFTVPKDAPQ